MPTDPNYSILYRPKVTKTFRDTSAFIRGYGKKKSKQPESLSFADSQGGTDTRERAFFTVCQGGTVVHGGNLILWIEQYKASR
jgi:hypothetical protein